MTLVRLYVAGLIATGWPRLLVAIILMVGGSLTEGVGVAVLVTVLQAAGLDTGGQAAVNEITASLRQAVAFFGIAPTLFPLLLVFVAAVGARALIGLLQSIAIYGIEQGFVFALRIRLYRAITYADWLYLTRTRASDFSTALTEESGRLGHATSQLLMLLADVIVSLILIGLALAISIPTTLLVLAASIGLLLVFSRSVRRLHGEGVEFSNALTAFHAAAIEQTQSLKLIKAFSAQNRTIARFATAAARVTSADRAMASRQAIVSASFEVGSTLTLVVLLYVGAELMRLPGAGLLTLMLVFSRLMPRFLSAHQHVRTFGAFLPAFAAVMALVERCEAAAEPVANSELAPAFTRELRFENVSFAYGRSTSPTVEDVDFSIERGSVLALVGLSGSGKSTLVDLACGLLFPSAGRILVDGVSLTQRNLRGWRESIGYAGAETPLFNASLRDNMLWACPAASDAAIAAVLRIAAIDVLVASLPGRLDAAVGDRGVLFSQGERQRIGLARALLREPRLLILDEATNGLDSETEEKVMATLRRARPDLTVLLVAHRLSTLQFADRIVVMEDGRVVEAGSWDELHASSGTRFLQLNKAQQFG